VQAHERFPGLCGWAKGGFGLEGFGWMLGGGGGELGIIKGRDWREGEAEGWCVEGISVREDGTLRRGGSGWMVG